MERVLVLKNLCCPNCAAKIETKINGQEWAEQAVFAMGTQQLRLNTSLADTTSLVNKVQAICDSVEDGVEVAVYERPSKAETLEEEEEEPTIPVWGLVLGVIVLLAAEFVTAIPEVISQGILVALYIALGYRVLWTAVKNIKSGRFLDENFLMSVATLGAIAIGQLPEAAGVMLFYQIGLYFEERAGNQSRKEIMAAVDMRPETVRLVTNDGQVSVVAPETVAVGDVYEVLAGDRIPLDGTVLEGTSRLDTAPVTGEPVPVGVTPGSEIVSGCVNGSGRLLVRVDKELKDSMVTRILDAVENAAANKPKIDRFITRFAAVYTPIVVAIAVAVAVVPPLFTGQWQYWIYTALTFLVISCPCALVLSVPLAFFAGIGRGSKQGILFKGGLAMETMQAIKAVAFDKTGTLTTGQFEVQSIDSVDDVEDTKVLLMAAAVEAGSNHPIGQSICKAAAQQGLTVPAVADLQEIAGRGLLGRVEGHSVAVGNRRLMGEMSIAGVPTVETAAPKAGSEALVAIDGHYVGCIYIGDAIKEDSAATIKLLQRHGLRTVMLTGDSEVGATAMAKVAGIDEVKAGLLPEDKVTAIQELRQKYGQVMFVGDGINDAPVLAGADVGGAMGSGTDAAIEAADVVYMRPGLGGVAESLRIAHNAVSVAKQNVVFALAVKGLVMVAGIAGFANMWAAVFADTGVSILCILNSVRLLYKK